jgi:hypothetical protein
MAKKQSAGELSRTIAGQWTKSEKREYASRQIMESKKRAFQAVKAVSKGWQK